MGDYHSIHTGQIIDATISATIAGKAGIQGISVNDTEITPDPSSNKVNINLPIVSQTTGQSTTQIMSQKAITDSLSQKADSSSLSSVATSGSYNDLSNKPTIPEVVQTTGTSTTQVMSQNSITTALGNKADLSNLSTVATSGSYNDLSNKPTIPEVVQTTGTSTTQVMSQDAVNTALSNKVDSSNLSTVATSGSYNDLSNKPTIPSVTNYTATLGSSSWSGASAPYTQTVNISGILSTDNPIVDVSNPTQTMLDDWACVSSIETSNGSITATCFSDKPSSNINIKLMVLR